MKKAFTLVELIVVISIIALTSIVWITSFFGFMEEQEINSKIEAFKDDINSLDKQVKNREIFDYKIKLEKWKNTYIVDKNSFSIEKSIIFSGNFIRLKNAIPSDNFGLKVYKWEKLFFSSWTLTEYNISSLDSNYDYRFLWFTSSSLNSLEIKNFDKEDFSLNILEMTPEEVFIQNVLWKKSFLDNAWNEISSINIIFEKDWKEVRLEL